MIPHETGCELLEIVQSEGYNENCFRNDLKLLFTQIGVYNKRTVVLFSIINDQVSQWNSVEIFFVLVFSFFFSLNYMEFEKCTKKFRICWINRICVKKNGVVASIKVSVTRSALSHFKRMTDFFFSSHSAVNTWNIWDDIVFFFVLFNWTFYFKLNPFYYCILSF